MEEHREIRHDGLGEAGWSENTEGSCERGAEAESQEPDGRAKIREDLREKTEELRSDLSDIARIAGEALQQGIEVLSKRGRCRIESVQGAIREQPIKGLMITAGVGVLIGFLLSRR